MGELTADRRVDLTIDGADEVDVHNLDLIKGRGGALLREKIVASVSDRFVIVVDESKLVERLGRSVLPVEVVPFGWEATAHKLRGLGAVPLLRKSGGGEAFVSEGGHYILDCTLSGDLSAAALGVALDGVVGVVEHGLFLGMTSRVFSAGAAGVREFTP